MLLAVAAAVSLGIWQLDVWRSNRDAAATTLVHAAPVPLAQVMGGDSAFPGADLGRPVTFSGTWLPSGTVYVSGRTHEARRGYWVVTPVLIGHSAMPVVRGWSTRPSAPAPQGTVSVTGWLQPSDGSGEADTDPHDDIIGSMRIASMTEHVSADLYSGYVVRRSVKPAGVAVDGLAPVRPPTYPSASSTTALRNFLYALQWWFFAGFAIYVWFRWCQDAVRTAEPEGGPGTVEA